MSIITITVQVDEKRLREAGRSADDQDVLALLESMRPGRLRLATLNDWLPVANMRVRTRLTAMTPMN
ncbi:MAG: hypothetical protein ACLQDY_02775 [Streptosporangiaceae bacterium]